MAQRYAQCSRFLLQTESARDQNAKYQVGRFKMAIIKDEGSIRSLNQDRTNLFQNLFQLSQLFLQQIGIGPNHMGRQNQKSVIDAAIRFTPGQGIEAELGSELSVLSRDKQKNITMIFAKQKHELLNQVDALREELARYKSNEANTLNGSARPNEPATTIDNAASDKKRKRGGDENMDDVREEIKNTKGMARLECILSIPGRYPVTSKLTGSARTMMNTAIFPIKKCLETHHGNSKQSFLKMWNLDKSFSKFGVKKCDGKGSSCGIHPRN
jgi:hypothetical protein